MRRILALMMLGVALRAPAQDLGTPVEEPEVAMAQEAPVAPTFTSVADAPPFEAERLVGGAPLFDPDVAVHIVEKKQFRDQGRLELILYPVVAQLNGEFSQHYGSALSLVWHLQENFGLQLTPVYNWSAQTSAFNRELNSSVSEEAQASASLLIRYGGILGVEVAPLYGKFAFYQGLLGRFQVVVNAGAGIASTEHELKPGNAAGVATYGNTGARFMGSVGAGFRVAIADRFTVRVEARDLLYAARVDRVNGCSQSDLQALVNERPSGNPLSGVSVSGSCRVSSFQGTVKSTGYNRESDLNNALNLTQERSSDVLNNLGVYAGVGMVF